MDELTALVIAAQAGDLEAFGRIVKRFQDMAYAKAYALLKDLDLAQDAAQDAFLEAYLNLSMLHEPAAFTPWFGKIVLAQSYRLRRKSPRSLLPLEAALEVPSDAPDSIAMVEEHEMRDMVRKAVESLPEPERVVTTLFYLAGCSQHEIATLSGAPITTVKKRLSTAKRHLKERLLHAAADYLQEQRPSKDKHFITTVRRLIQMILLSANDRLYVMRPDGSHVVPLTEPGIYTGLDWFPDGQKILYGMGKIVDGLVVAQHYTMNVNGWEQQTVGPSWVSGGSRISPDGQKIAFTSHKDHPTLFPEFNRSEIYVMEADGTNILRLTNNLVEDNGPTWTPDGQILFCRDVSGNATQCQLFIINPDGTGETSYPPGGLETFGNWPVFSPDGTKIAYKVEHELWIMNADASDKRQLTDLGAWISAPPSWSPDGRRIVFVANHNLYIIRADGSSGLRPEPVATGLDGLNTPVWGRGARS
jgi:RNA polymerase sigma factor (sigma-70 family)